MEDSMQTKFLNREAFPIVTGTKSVKINAQKQKKKKKDNNDDKMGQIKKSQQRRIFLWTHLL